MLGIPQPLPRIPVVLFQDVTQPSPSKIERKRVRKQIDHRKPPEIDHIENERLIVEEEFIYEVEGLQ